MADNKYKISSEELANITKYHDWQQKTNEELQKEILLYEEVVKRITDKTEKLKLEDKIAQARLDLDARRLSLLEKSYPIEKAASESALKSLERQISFFKELGVEKEKIKELEREREKAQAHYEKVLKRLDEIASLRGQISEQKKLLKLQQKSTQSIEDAGDAAKDFIGKFGINDKWKNTIWGKLAESSKREGGMAASLSEMAKSSKDALAPTNILGSAMGAVVNASRELLKQQEESLSQFNRSTAAAGRYNSVIRDVGRDNLSLGIDTKDAADAVGALFEGMRGFTELSTSTQAQVVKFSATMAEFGVNTQDTAEIFNELTKTFGMTVQQAEEAQRQLLATSQTLGVSAKTTFSEFSAALPALAAQGDKAIQVFKELQVEAKKLGTSVKILMDLTDQFDTFEGAAEAVGKLNTVLGGNFLDSMRMVAETDPSKRIVMLKEALDSAGKSFDDMGKYERQALANAAGFKDVALMGKIMKNSIEDVAGAAKNSAIEQNKMNELAERAQSIFDKLKMVFMSLAVSFGPLIDLFSEGVSTLLELNEQLGGYLIPGLTVLFAVMGGGVNLLSGVFGIFKMIGGAVMGMVGSLVPASAGISSMSATLATAAPALATFGASALMVAGAIALTGAGVALITYSFIKLFEAIAENTVLLPMIAASIFSLGAGFAMLAISSPLAAVGLLAMSSSFLALGLALATIRTRDLEALGTIFEGIGNLGGGVVDMLAEIPSMIKEIAQALDDLPVSKAMVFETTMQSISEAATLSPKAVENVQRLVDEAARYREIKETTVTNREDNFINLIKTATAAPAAAAGQSSSNRPVQINVNLEGRPFKKMIIGTVEDLINPRK